MILLSTNHNGWYIFAFIIIVAILLGLLLVGITKLIKSRRKYFKPPLDSNDVEFINRNIGMENSIKQPVILGKDSSGEYRVGYDPYKEQNQLSEEEKSFIDDYYKGMPKQ